MHAFFVQTSFLSLEFGFEQTFVRKTRAFKADEIDVLYNKKVIKFKGNIMLKNSFKKVLHDCTLHCIASTKFQT